MQMNVEEHKADGAEEALDHGERPGRTPNHIDRRSVLKLALASAPVIISFTAGVPIADAGGYNYDSGPQTSSVVEPDPVDSKDGDTPSGDDWFKKKKKK